MCSGGSSSRGSPVISRENSRARTPGRKLLRAQSIVTNHIPLKTRRRITENNGEKVLCKLGLDILQRNVFGFGILRPNLILQPLKGKGSK